MTKPFDPRRYADTLHSDYPPASLLKSNRAGCVKRLDRPDIGSRPSVVSTSGRRQNDLQGEKYGSSECNPDGHKQASFRRGRTSKFPFGHSGFRPLHFAKPGTVSGFPSADSFNIYRKPLTSRQDVIPRDTNPGRPIILQGERPDTIRLPPEFQVFGGRPPRIRRQQLILVKVVPSVLPGKMLMYQSANVIR